MIHRFGLSGGFYGAEVGPIVNISFFEHFDRDLDRLEQRLGCSLSRQKHEIEKSAWYLVNTAVFRATAVSKDELSELLSSVAKNASELVEVLSFCSGNQAASAHGLVQSFLYSCTNAPEEGITLDVIVESLSSIARLSEGASVEYSAAPGRVGSPGIAARKNYLRRLVVIAKSAGASLELPTNQNRDWKTTPLLKFAGEALRLAARKGKAGIDALSLTPTQNEAAWDNVVHFTSASKRSLIDNLRKAKQQVLGAAQLRSIE
jgi:hypothetical protein